MNQPTSPAETVSSERLLCLSVRQPWAWLIVNGWKNIENRDWPTRVRGLVLIHAGKGMTRDEYDACQLFVDGFADHLSLPMPEDLERGGIVGQATILDCVNRHMSEWFVGRWGFVLADQKPLPFEPLRGQLGFFMVSRHNSIIRPYSHAVLVPEKRPCSQGKRRTAAALCQSQSQRVTRQIGTPHKT